MQSNMQQPGMVNAIIRAQKAPADAEVSVSKTLMKSNNPIYSCFSNKHETLTQTWSSHQVAGDAERVVQAAAHFVKHHAVAATHPDGDGAEVGAALDDDAAVLGGAVAHLAHALGKTQLVRTQLLQRAQLRTLKYYA
jgi:hypothetical protein